MFKELLNLKNRPVREVGIKLFVLVSMAFVTYYIVNAVYKKVVEGFDPHAQTNKISECDVGTENAGSKWWNYLVQQ